jgi:hypothetical protein
MFEGDFVYTCATHFCLGWWGAEWRVAPVQRTHIGARGNLLWAVTIDEQSRAWSVLFGLFWFVRDRFSSHEHKQRKKIIIKYFSLEQSFVTFSLVFRLIILRPVDRTSIYSIGQNLPMTPHTTQFLIQTSSLTNVPLKFVLPVVYSPW